MAAKEPAQATTPPKRDHELYIMRHGIAVTRGAGSFADDSKRPLTPEGKMKVQEIAKGLLRLGFEVDWILTSPLVRAVETAEIVSDALRPSVPTDFVEALKPGGSPEAVITFLARAPGRRGPERQSRIQESRVLPDPLYGIPAESARRTRMVAHAAHHAQAGVSLAAAPTAGAGWKPALREVRYYPPV